MAKKNSGKTTRTAPRPSLRRRLFRWSLRAVSIVFLVMSALTVLYAAVNPPTTIYMLQESRRLGGLERQWVTLDNVAPVMARVVVAAEDANFCNHWGFDLVAIRTAIEEGSGRGASTISQQVVKNVYLWQGRNWTRKAIEAVMTPMIEAIWSKRRIIEVYLNVVEFDDGIFGIHAAARHYFGVTPDALSDVQAARLAAILPLPKERSASNPSQSVRRRAAAVLDGAATIDADGRASCFQS
ncbi:monofunctional biosynthetic peptidoglycan transglycosylase [Pseudosulfitobacter koreensis]|uniref:Biosynthetic peptidoglycan transglycosylase n=1 Tax=Pseudosulfitobacter koreensis TaxID=2968472 RepID=A0ABT1Z0Y2_9RHOB|nr:monofunctional biosynthetic peptidoglycan transglycosylase [Pseudosulfitobacter koreense]MCR8826765.1 monofunctional biosynthetic peptidoglycan transglycosylase [Pseudosulfitobacter koreense]